MDLPQSIQSQVFSEILDEDVQKGTCIRNLKCSFTSYMQEIFMKNISIQIECLMLNLVDV